MLRRCRRREHGNAQNAVRDFVLQRVGARVAGLIVKPVTAAQGGRSVLWIALWRAQARAVTAHGI